MLCIYMDMVRYQHVNTKCGVIYETLVNCLCEFGVVGHGFIGVRDGRKTQTRETHPNPNPSQRAKPELTGFGFGFG